MDFKYTKRAMRLNNKLAEFVEKNTSTMNASTFVQGLRKAVENDITTIVELGFAPTRNIANDAKIRALGQYRVSIRFHRKRWVAFYDTQWERVRVGGIVSSATVANAPYLPRLGMIQ